jgi:hypothetical protein
MDRVLELETGQPAAMQLGPGRPAIVASLAQQKTGELLTHAAQAVHRVEPGPKGSTATPRTTGPTTNASSMCSN